MKILIAPDSFKGSMRAVNLCRLFEEKLTHSNIEFNTVPLADGGEGSLEAIEYSSDFQKVQVEVHGPDFQKRESYYLFDKENETAYVELAEASGLELIDTDLITCMDTTTLGTGELIRHAIAAGAKRIVLFIGGSSTNDGAMGIATALGFRFLNKNGETLRPIGRNLIEIKSIDSNNAISVEGIDFLVASDVNNPFFGPNGAAHVYAKQKGASPNEIAYLDNGLRNLQQLILEKYLLDLQELPGAGAAGGVGGGMAAFCGAKLTPGAELVFESTKLEEQIECTDYVITGEGKTDEQTLHGKLVARVLNLAKKHATPALLFCGFFEGDEQLQEKLGVQKVFALAKSKAEIPSAIANVEEKSKLIIDEMIAFLK